MLALKILMVTSNSGCKPIINLDAAARHEMVAESQPKLQRRWNPPICLHCCGEQLSTASEHHLNALQLACKYNVWQLSSGNIAYVSFAPEGGDRTNSLFLSRPVSV